MGLSYNSYKSITHALSLAGATKIKSFWALGGLVSTNAEGWSEISAQQYSKKQFLKLTGDTLNAKSVAFYSWSISKKNFIEQLSSMPHGQALTISTVWEQHAVSFTFIKENNNIHVIFNNRGQNANERLNPNFAKSIEVYTLDQTDKSFVRYLHDIYDTCRGLNISGISFFRKMPAFLHWLVWPLVVLNQMFALISSIDFLRKSFDYLLNKSDFSTKKNYDITKELSQSFQKVGNCALASQNLSWHLRLAGQEMSLQPRLSFQSAYERTRPVYHQLREKNRFEEFKKLLDHKDDFRVGWEELVLQALGVVVKRSLIQKKYYNLDRLLEELSRHPNYLTLIKDLLQDPRLLMLTTINFQSFNSEEVKNDINTKMSKMSSLFSYPLSRWGESVSQYTKLLNLTLEGKNLKNIVSARKKYSHLTNEILALKIALPLVLNRAAVLDRVNTYRDGGVYTAAPVQAQNESVSVLSPLLINKKPYMYVKPSPHKPFKPPLAR